MEIVFGQNIKVMQIIILAFCILFCIFAFSAALYSQDNDYFIISIAAFLLFTGINWLYSNVYEIRVNETMIICSNLYHRKKFNIAQFDSITTSNKYIPPIIIFPFPSPPYFVFKIKNEQGFIFLDSSYKAFFSIFNVGKYLKDLNSKVNAISPKAKL